MRATAADLKKDAKKRKKLSLNTKIEGWPVGMVYELGRGVLATLKGQDKITKNGIFINYYSDKMFMVPLSRIKNIAEI